MTTLIAAYDSDGCCGRCDARCYNATTPHCDCICGGMNHGKGLQTALQNTSEMVEEWIDKYNEKHPDRSIDYKRPAIQLDMFGELSIVPGMEIHDERA